MTNENQKSGSTQNSPQDVVKDAFAEINKMGKELHLQLDEQALKQFARFYQNPSMERSEKQDLLEVLNSLRLGARSLRILDLLLEEDPEQHLEVLNALARKAMDKDNPIGDAAEETLLGYISLSASLAVDRAQSA